MPVFNNGADATPNTIEEAESSLPAAPDYHHGAEVSRNSSSQQTAGTDALSHAHNTDVGTNAAFFELGLNRAVASAGAIRRGLLFNNGPGEVKTAWAYEFRDNGGNLTGRFVKCDNVIDGNPEDAGNLWEEAGGGGTFPADTSPIAVNLSNGKSLGKYTTGQSIDVAGRTYLQVFTDIAQENVAPVVSLSGNVGSPQPYNQTGLSPVLTWAYQIKSLGATLTNFKLERRRGGSGSWSQLLSTATPPANFTDAGQNVAADNRVLEYRLTVTDSNGDTAAASYSVTFAAYTAPVINLTFSEATIRERGNISTTLSGSIAATAPNVPLVSYQLQRRNGGGAYVNFGSPVALAGASGVIAPTVHADPALVDANSISYRAVVTDAEGATNGGGVSVSFETRSVLGYSSNASPGLATVLAFGNSAITNGRARTISGVSAGPGEFTFYAYDAGAGALANVVQNGAAPVLGAFTELAQLTGPNTFGATVTLRLYKSNADNAFTNSTLAFS